jgi:hypothetical protein
MALLNNENYELLWNCASKNVIYFPPLPQEHGMDRVDEVTGAKLASSVQKGGSIFRERYGLHLVVRLCSFNSRINMSN